MDLYIDNDNVLTLVGLQNSVSAAYLNAATVAVTLTDADDTEISGETWPLTMSYVSGSDGNYRATLPDTLTGLTTLDELSATITADAGAGLAAKWVIPLTAKTRTS